MHRQIYVIAGNPEEARQWAKEVQLKADQWVYLHSVKTCEGRWKGSKFAAVGSYDKRGDYHKIRRYVNVLRPAFAKGWEFV